MKLLHGPKGVLKTLTLAVAGVLRAVVAADGRVGHVQLLVLVALPHRAPHARVVRPQLATCTDTAAFRTYCSSNDRLICTCFCSGDRRYETGHNGL